MPRAKKTVAEEVKKVEGTEVKATEKKTPAKRTSKKAVKTELYLEFNGVKVSADDIVNNVKATYAAQGKEADIKSLKIYVKPDENAAYYVVNDDFSDRMDVYFCE